MSSLPARWTRMLSLVDWTKKKGLLYSVDTRMMYNPSNGVPMENYWHLVPLIVPPEYVHNFVYSLLPNSKIWSLDQDTAIHVLRGHQSEVHTIHWNSSGLGSDFSTNLVLMTYTILTNVSAILNTIYFC